MISYLKGQILAKQEQSLILNTGNIGYLVHIPIPLFAELNEKDEIELYIHTHVREDNLSLYGFKTLAELKFFDLLLSVSGIGPKMALNLTSVSIPTIKNAIFNEDLITLTKIKGLGKKTAERLILELKNKVEPSSDNPAISSPDIDPDAVSALINLGYSPYVITKTLSGLKSEEIPKTAEEIIKYFLKNV